MPGLLSRVVVTLVALAGLFAMHGLADHGVAGHGVAGHGVAPTAHHAATGDSGHGAPDPAAPATHGPVELCLALLALGLLLLLGRGPQVERRNTLLPAAPTGWRAPSRPRTSDPPDLFALSVQRC